MVKPGQRDPKLARVWLLVPFHGLFIPLSFILAGHVCPAMGKVEGVAETARGCGHCILL